MKERTEDRPQRLWWEAELPAPCRSLLSKMEQLKLSGPEQERLCRTLRAMLACLHERSYSDNLKRLEQMDARFGRHFRRAWHERRDLWAGFRRGGIVPWCQGVNDRIEALVQFLQVGRVGWPRGSLRGRPAGRLVLSPGGACARGSVSLVPL